MVDQLCLKKLGHCTGRLGDPIIFLCPGGLCDGGPAALAGCSPAASPVLGTALNCILKYQTPTTPLPIPPLPLPPSLLPPCRTLYTHTKSLPQQIHHTSILNRHPLALWSCGFREETCLWHLSGDKIPLSCATLSPIETVSRPKTLVISTSFSLALEYTGTLVLPP